MATKKVAVKEKRPAGRDSTFTAQKAEKICEELAKGTPLAEICRVEGMPAVRTVSDWKAARPEFAAAFTRARDDGFDAIAAECLEIADDGRNDYMMQVADKGDEKAIAILDYSAEHVQRSKLRIETRLKLLAKWDPRRYGEKLALGGADDLPPIKTMTDEQLAARVAALQKKVGGDEQG